MKKKFINFLTTFKNSLDADAGAIAVSVQELISELEASEDVITADDLTKRIKDLLPAEVESDSVTNKLRTLFNRFRNEMKAVSPANAQGDWKMKICNAMVGSHSAAEFRNAITGMPSAVEIFGEVSTPWGVDAGLFGAMRKIGSVNTTIPYTADDDADTFAFGHVKGTQKNDQDFELAPKQLVNQMIYKQLPINRADLYAYAVSNADQSAFVKWVMQELPERLYSTIERTVICGNDWQTTAANKVTSFEGVGSKTVADAFTAITTFPSAPSTDAHRNTIMGDLSELSVGIDNKGKDKWLYVSPTLLAFLMKRLYASGGNYHFVGYDALAAELNVAKVIPYKYLGSGATAGDIMAVIVTPELYYRAGGELFGEQWTAYEYNQEYYRAEIFASGAIGGLNSTAVLKRAS